LPTQLSPNNYEIDCTGEKVRIGSAGNEFSPVIRFNRWNESYVELNLIGGGQAAKFNSSSIVDGVVTAENQWFKLEYSEVGVKPGWNELGGVDYVITLKKYPGLNSVGFTYNHQKCNAYLQPPLTQAEIDEGAVRPDHVVNSIAFYGDPEQANNSYKTGKIGHLYRLRVTDALGAQTWADWGFGGGQSQITLTIPQAFLNAATYPVVIAPVGDTFGYTSEGGTEWETPSYADVYGSVFAGVAGTITVLSLYIFERDWEAYLSMAVYQESDYSLIDTSETYTGTELAYKWIHLDVNTGAQITAQDYLLALRSNQISFFYDLFIGDHATMYGVEGEEWPDPFVADDTGTMKISIYCTYTAGGGAPVLTAEKVSNFIRLSWS